MKRKKMICLPKIIKLLSRLIRLNSLIFWRTGYPSLFTSSFFLITILIIACPPTATNPSQRLRKMGSLTTIVLPNRKDSGEAHPEVVQASFLKLKSKEGK